MGLPMQVEHSTVDDDEPAEDYREYASPGGDLESDGNQ
jgi:hypothetical protein